VSQPPGSPPLIVRRKNTFSVAALLSRALLRLLAGMVSRSDAFGLSGGPPREAAAREIEVRTPSRLHLGMFSFGDEQVRSYGGVGVMVDRPGIHLRMKPATEIAAQGLLADRAVWFAKDAARHWDFAADEGVAIEVTSAPREHVGLGSGTQLGLAVAAGMWHLWRRTASDPQEEYFFDRSEVVDYADAVARGKRSCVGIHGFTRGGLIVEAGRHTGDKAKKSPTRLSPMVARVRLPSAWRCVVLVQKDAVGFWGEAERKAFASLPPVPREISSELARIALLDMLPAVSEGSYEGFCDALCAYGTLAGKPFEAASSTLPHAEAIADLIELLRELGVRGAAQSSWGPAVMGCCKTLEQAGDLLEQLERLKIRDQFDTWITRFDNDGASIRVVA
jgi:beta-ribofuranosylaminobenzene 5'-phosphate synthase